MREVRIRNIARSIVERSDGSPQPFVGLESIEGFAGRLRADDIPAKSADDSLSHRTGDVLFSKLRPYLAKSLLAVKPGTGTGELLVLRSTNMLEPRYLLYVTLSRPWLDWAEMTSFGSKMPRTSWEAMSDYRLRLPPLDEQRRIADFLDTETTRIDIASRLAASRITLLNEFRLSYIDAEVFADTNAPRVRLGYLSNLVTSGPRGWGEYVGSDGSPFFRSANLRRDSVEPNLTEVARVNPPPDAAAEARRSRVRLGDALIGITGANTGWVAHAEEAITGANVSQHVCLVRPGPRLHALWLAYLLASPSVQDGLLGAQYGGTKTQLSLPDIRAVRVPLLSLNQQSEIAGRIGKKMRSIQRLVLTQEAQRTLLLERRQALITAAVTGQFDVTTASGRA